MDHKSHGKREIFSAKKSSRQKKNGSGKKMFLRQIFDKCASEGVILVSSYKVSDTQSASVLENEHLHMRFHFFEYQGVPGHLCYPLNPPLFFQL